MVTFPPQVIYAGRSHNFVPSVSFPKTWYITFTDNHWANECTTIDYIRKVLVPYVQEVHQSRSFLVNHTALVIFDRFKGQCTPTVFQLLSENNIQIAIVPANLTDRLQPLDISVNKAVKDHLCKRFSEWYSEQVSRKVVNNSQSEEASTEEPAVLSGSRIDLSLSTLKPLGAKWLMSTYDHFKTNKDIIVNGFKKAGIIPKNEMDE